MTTFLCIACQHAYDANSLHSGHASDCLYALNQAGPALAIWVPAISQRAIEALESKKPIREQDRASMDKMYKLDLPQKGSVFAYTSSRGKTYYLHGRATTLKSGRTQTIYYFGKSIKEGALETIPEGYEIRESKNGLPVLKMKT